MAKPVVLVTGANGEIGRSLLQTIAESGGFDVVTLDLTLPPDAMRALAVASYAGNIMDRYLLDQVAAHHEVDMVFHLAALLSTRGERDPELAHQVNVEGTLNVLRMAQNQSARLGRPVRFIFPSSIAVYGLPSLEEKRAIGRIREEQWNVPITMYGCNKLYCEHLGRYFTSHARQLGAARGGCAPRLSLHSLSRAHLGRDGADRRHERLRSRRCSTRPAAGSRTRASSGPTRASRSWPCRTRFAPCLTWRARTANG